MDIGGLFFLSKLAPRVSLRYDSVMSSRTYFKGKRVAVIGLGVHGEMLSDIAFLIRSGAIVAVYDIRSEARLKEYIMSLRTAGLISYVCGSVPPDDLLDVDMILLSHEYTREASFLIPAQTQGIQIEYPETLFFSLAPAVTVVGVIGSAGKSTVMSMLIPMLETVCGTDKDQRLYVVDSESDKGILSQLPRMKSNDVVLLRIESAMLVELHAVRMSPYVAVLTSVPMGHYTKSPFEILSYQTYNNFVVAHDTVIDAIHENGFHIRAKMFRTKATSLPSDWHFKGSGIHDRENAALAIEVATIFKVSTDAIRDTLEKWKPLKGRLEFVRKVKHVEFYNDTASIVSYATEKALHMLAHQRNIILILGGVDTGEDYQRLCALLSRMVHTIVLIPGSGTLKVRSAIQKLEYVSVHSVPSVEEAVYRSLECAKSGDRILFSPGFQAGGFDLSRKERGERFVRAVKEL
jgi:UDP-N-acetylmuramoylalanine--D-glutamate ligase